MNSITLKAYAKINLFLEVCEMRPDSYHNIDSIMQTVSLHDVVKVTKDNSILLTNNAGLPNDKDNLAYKAAKLFFDFTKINSGAKIHIEKNIPISAGLAGGSTDAAAVLKGLNSIYETNIDIDTLCALGSKIGADVPFCIKGGTYLTKGIGDIFTSCTSLPKCFIVISKSGEGVSTPYAYGEIDKMRKFAKSTYKSSSGILNALNSQDLYKIADNMYNVFETVVCPVRPMVDEQKIILQKHDAVYSMMSGSGPSVFGLFNNPKSAEEALKELKEYGANAHICTPV